MNIMYTNTLTVEQYNRMRISVGWDSFPSHQVETALNRSDFITVANQNGMPVGMARVVTDGVQALIMDVIVIPEYQGKRIGGTLMGQVMNFIESKMKNGDKMWINLMAAKGKEDFYKKFGFEIRPNERRGCGMTRWLEKRSVEE